MAASQDRSPEDRTRLQPTDPNKQGPTGGEKTSPRGRPPIAPSSAEHAKRLLERSTAVPMKRFDSADFFLNKYMEDQKLEAARAAMSARRLSPRSEEECSSGAHPTRTSSPRPDLLQHPPLPSRLDVPAAWRGHRASPTPLSPKSPPPGMR